MMLITKNLILVILIASLLSSCGSATSSLESIQATAEHVAATSIVLTLTAMPTNTPLPTDTPQPSPTFTAMTSPTPSETATSTPQLLFTWAPYGEPDSGAFATARADKSKGNTPLLLENQSDKRIQFILVSPQYQEYVFTNNLGLVLPQGQYSYRAWIGESGPFSGSFTLNNPDKHVLTFYPNKIHFSTP